MTISPAVEQISNFTGKGIGFANRDMKGSETDSFSDVMNFATTNNGSFQNGKKFKDDYSEKLSVSNDSTQKYKMDNNYKENRVRKLEDKSDTNSNDNKLNDKNVINKEADSLDSSTQNVDESEMKISGELKEKILNKVADELGLDIDKLVEVLGQLGMEVSDLILPDNVSKLVSEVMGDGNVSDILMNENISDAVLNINSDISEILTEDLSDESIIEQIDLTEANIDDDELVIPLKKSNINKTVSDDSDMEYDIDSDEVSEYDSKFENSDNEQKITLNKNYKESNTDSNNNTGLNQFSAPVDFQNNQFSELITDNKNMTYSSVDPEEILSQVRDSIKAEISEEIKELSIHLNPENLGNVHLTVTAKEGVVTAMLLTENEAVQSALEAQMALIKDSLNEQGVKIEAIEVMVGAHEFEQNLDDNNNQNEAQEKMEAQLKKATRKLNLADIYADDNIEDLDESEIVTAKMMAADGNMMDYKV